MRIQPVRWAGGAASLCLATAVLACGGGSPRLTVAPAAEVITVDLELGSETGALQLEAFLNGKALPGNNVSWSSSSACLGVNAVGSIGCNPSCGSYTNTGGTQFTATVTAAAEGMTATSSITCQYQ